MKNLKFIVPLLFIILVVCCCQDAANELPTFDPVQINENTVHLENANEDDNHKIVLVDTSEDKILYTYEFKGYNIHDCQFNYDFGKRLFIELVGNRYLMLNISTGEITDLNLDFTVSTSFIFDNQLWIFPIQRDEKGQSTKVMKYDKNMQPYWDVFKEGISYGDHARFNDNDYLAYFSQMSDFYGIYNYTTDALIDISEIETKGNLPFLKNSFLMFRYDKETETGHKSATDIFKVKSFEPLSYEKIYSTPTELDCIVSEVYEHENDIFLYSREFIIVLDKATKQLKNKTNLPDAKYVSFSHCRNGSIWCCAEKSDGVYKFNMSDYSLKVIH